MGIVHAKGLEQRPQDQTTQRLLELPVTVKKINVDGLGRTKDDIVINSVKDLFTASSFFTTIAKIHEAKEKLENLGCFKNISVYLDTFEKDGVQDALEVTFSLEELRMLGSRVQGDIGNNEGSLLTGANLRNIFGRGESLSAVYSRSTNHASSFQSTFVKPFHNESQTEFSTQIFKNLSQAPWSGYKETDIGLLMSLGLIAGEMEHKFSWGTTWRDLSCLSSSTTFPVREESGHSLKSSVFHEVTKDTRDDNIFPTDGVLFRLKNEVAGLGGDVKFAKGELNFQLNFPLVKNFILQGELQGGHMTPLGEGKTHHITDRFVLGGPNSFRGFEMAGIGPHSQGCALGAQTYWTAGLHLYAPMPLLEPGGPIARKFRLHGFVNIGNAGNISAKSKQAIAEEILRDMRLSYGAGFAMNLAGIARVELNYCVPLVVQRGDRPRQGFQFGISANFF